MSATISVIVPVHNGGDDFRRCVEGLKNLSPQPDQIIIVADGESDGAWRLAEGMGWRIVRCDVTGGPARARNRGAREATGDLLFFLDADVVPCSDAVAKVRETFEADLELAALIGSYDDEPACRRWLAQYKNLQHHYVHQTGGDEAFTFWAGCGAIRRGVFAEIGGFDAGYREPSIEDIELGYRLKSAGRRIRLRKDLQVKHLKRWTAGSLVKTDFFRRALPWSELILRQQHLTNDLNINTASRLSVVSVFVLLLALTAAPIYHSAMWPACGAAGALVLLNHGFYRFLLRKRGPWFTLAVMPWHWFYYFYGGVAFAIAHFRHFTGRLPAKTA
jgi:GT2 family glycosyltransferase